MGEGEKRGSRRGKEEVRKRGGERVGHGRRREGKERARRGTREGKEENTEGEARGKRGLEEGKGKRSGHVMCGGLEGSVK